MTIKKNGSIYYVGGFYWNLKTDEQVRDVYLYDGEKYLTLTYELTLSELEEFLKDSEQVSLGVLAKIAVPEGANDNPCRIRF